MRILLKENFQSTLKIVCLIVLATTFYLVIRTESEDFWLQFHETFYLTAPLIGILVAFHFSSEWAAILSFGLANVFILTDAFHGQFFPVLGLGASLAGNSQFNRLALYALALLILIPSLFWKRQRLFKTFALILISVNLFVVFNNHHGYPDGVLKELVDNYKLNLRSLGEEKDPKILSSICKRFKISCFLVEPNYVTKILHQENLEPKIEGQYNLYKGKSYGTALTSEVSFVDTNKNASLDRKSVV